MAASDTIALIVVAAVLCLVIVIFVRISIRLRRGGGSLTTVVLGATDEFLTKDKKRAAETIVNENAGKRMEDQSSSAPH